MEPGEILKSKKVVNLDLPLSAHHSPIIDKFESRYLASSNLGYNVHVISTYLPSSSPDKKGKTKGKRADLEVPEAPKLPDCLEKLKNNDIYDVLNQIDEELGETNDILIGKKRKGKKTKNLVAKKQKVENLENPEAKNVPKTPTAPYFLKRVTVELKTIDDQIKIQRNVQNKGYDIIAVLPRTEELLKSACKQLDVDLIVLDLAHPDDKKYLTPNRGSISEARKRGIYFEIQYSNLLKPNNHIKYLPKIFSCIHMVTGNTAHCANLKSVTPNIVLSASSTQVSDLRSYKDVEGLLDLFDLSQEKANVIVNKHPVRVLLRAFQRKTAKSAVFVEEVSVGKLELENSDDKNSDGKNDDGKNGGNEISETADSSVGIENV
jgi:RNase P/RNase MRP subunit p30